MRAGGRDRVRFCHRAHRHPTRLTLRTRPDFERFFNGLEMVEPGVVPLPEWHGPGSEYPIPCYAGMGRKP